ncbi:peroxide stress protein YaaA [bacterium]|nr:peroxide stress protein YaaA [bacterium]
MKVLLNTTKTMAFDTPVPRGIAVGEPAFRAEAADLVAQLRDLDQGELSRVMDLSDALAAGTRADLGQWGEPGRPSAPALAAFTGLVFKHLDPASLRAPAWRWAGEHLLILSGLYGLLGALDRIEAYRLEMGCKFVPDSARNLTAFWKPRVTDALNERLDDGEPVINLAAGEYLKAVDRKRLRGPVIWPVFKERREDGSLRVVTVHAKEARGLMARFVLEKRVTSPGKLLAFHDAGWEAAEDVPEQGEWLFVR